MKTGEKIRFLRIKNNLTSKELSIALGISESAISLYENSKRKPSIDLIVKFADYFNVSTDFLLGVPSSYKAKHNAPVLDFSIALEKLISSLNNQDYIFFDGKDVDPKTIMVFKNNLNLVLENMRIIAGK